MTPAILCIKVDVDTERGTRIGVPNLVALFKRYNIPATFLFSLGPDNTGRAIKRIFRRGFLKKVSRTSVISTYGLRTLLNGLLFPGPHIAKRHGAIMREVRDLGFEVGIHCYDHIRWQDGLAKMSRQAVFNELNKAMTAFQQVFSTPAQTAGAAGWQANAYSLAAYDAVNLLYASDTRGYQPFFPRIADQVFKTLQIPTTLATLDELLGRPEFPEHRLIDYYLSQLKPSLANSLRPNVMTIHAEVEGMAKLQWFEAFLQAVQTPSVSKAIECRLLQDVAKKLLQNKQDIPVNNLIMNEIDGRSGTLAVQSVM